MITNPKVRNDCQKYVIWGTAEMHRVQEQSIRHNAHASSAASSFQLLAGRKMADASSGSSNQVPLADIISTAQNLVTILSNSLSSAGNVRPARQGRADPGCGQGAQTEKAQSSHRSQSVQQEMARSFPGFFRKERGKTPKGELELRLMLAGLGKRSLTIDENITHSELTDLLVKAYPKLTNISGGWLLHKSTGGGGQRKLLVVPPDSDGYSGQQLKAISGNGKCIMYIAPLQEEIDSTALPPEAKEFEQMPKAQCTSCRKMFPLQALPIHIQECQKEQVDLCISSDNENCTEEDSVSNDLDIQREMTAECPMCKKLFNVDVIEVHASDCGLRTAEHGVSMSDHPIDCFQSSDDILNWISGQVEETNTFSICVSRTDLFTRGMQQWQRQKKTSPKCRLRVTFFGEAGIDTGALSKEFLTEMLAEIERKLFVCSADKKGKNPLYCLNSLDQNYFRSAGEIMAASLAQGGPPPAFMREWCFRYLCSGDSDSIQVSATDVTDRELSLLIETISSATDDELGEHTDEILNCGYTGRVSVEKKDHIIRAVILHSTMRVVPVLDQLRKGLLLYDLLKIMNLYPELCLPLFVPGDDDKVDAAFILEKCHPDFSEKGSLKYSKEINIMNLFQDFLQEIEDQEQGEHGEMSVGKIMQWMTGQGHKPLLPSEKQDFSITVKFYHDCDGSHTVCFPTVSACSRTITFPSAHLKTSDDFKNIMYLAISCGESFDRM
ncbi:uncharacterized protein LOC143482236 isoform X2 [Brachyhypopomus gauderio]|uniref:uncharacterized protein LOC143482236 isoform X2 n=1 Tax=Brachyhypopomus gauderio TaxID=698409 RepID=UPI0040428EB7